MRKITLSLEAIFLELTTQEEPVDTVADGSDNTETAAGASETVVTEQERA
jgi:hypothetical protein